MAEDQLLTISEISERLKIPKHTLRFWEKELPGLFVPVRTRGRQRRFTSENVAAIEEIKRLRERRMSLTEIKRRLNERHPQEVSSSNKIDQLATRVAEVVKAEVYNFFESGKGS
ncbi:MAG: MerR family transcriptional regulator [Deltaproteobacteria bacterium]|nr:MerR family transcriptional regulator [Deltaproteobacteria bacterium]